MQTCCAMAARLQNAVATCTAAYFRERMSEERDVASWEVVIVISRGVSMPLVRGTERTSSVEGDGGEDRSHAFGIRDLRSACLRAAIAFHGGSEAIVRLLMVGRCEKWFNRILRCC